MEMNDFQWADLMKLVDGGIFEKTTQTQYDGDTAESSSKASSESHLVFGLKSGPFGLANSLLRDLPFGDAGSCLRRTFWKNVFKMAERDSKRTTITTEELVALPFVFNYKGMESKFGVESKFRVFGPLEEAGGLFTGGLTLPMYPELRWRLSSKENRCFLLIEFFPPHEVSRRSDWTWVVQNRNVVFENPRAY